MKIVHLSLDSRRNGFHLNAMLDKTHVELKEGGDQVSPELQLKLLNHDRKKKKFVRILFDKNIREMLVQVWSSKRYFEKIRKSKFYNTYNDNRCIVLDEGML